MGGNKLLSLPHRFETPGCRTTHPALSNPGRLMRPLRPIVGILRIIVDNTWHQLPVSNTITSQLIRHDLPGLAAVVPNQSLEESLRRCSVTAGLQEFINDFPILSLANF
jgi:hypothetical protein